MMTPVLRFTIPSLMLVVSLLFPRLAFPHGGGLDRYGCHHDRKRGGYHCHRGPLAGRSFASQAEMLEELRKLGQGGALTGEKPGKGERDACLRPALDRLTPARVVDVVDGDTIEVEVGGRREHVRYIGVNTPETHHPTKGVEPYGREAAEANRRLVTGKTVYLDFDVGRRDRYGRLLAYVYLADGTFVNAWLVENGYAQVMTVPPNVRCQDLFLRLQREAREAGRGLWGKPP